MAFNEEEALRFLEGGTAQPSNEAMSAEEFLESAPEKAEPMPAPQPKKQGSMIQPVIDIATGFNDELLDLLGLPGDLFDLAAEKLGSDLRVGGSDELKRMGRKIGMGTHPPEVPAPDTGSYQAGQYTALGLEFLAPFMAWTKPVRMAAPGAKTTGLAMQATPSTKGTTRLVAEQAAKPFASSPRTAYAAEVLGGVGSGYGAYYGEKEFGTIGGQVGGLVGGVVPGVSIHNASRVRNYVLESFAPYTPEGGKARAASIVRSLAEDPDVRKAVERSEADVLPDAKITTGKLSRDPHLQALEKSIVDEDPALARELRIQDEINNRISRDALSGMKGDAVIEDAQKLLSSRFMKLQNRLNARIDLAVKKAQESAGGLVSSKARAEVNKSVKGQIDRALNDARNTENQLWGLVDKDAIAPTSTTKKVFKDHLLDRFKSDDPSEIPNFLYKFLGRINNRGDLWKGVYTQSEKVGELHSLRSRILKEIRVEKAKDVPDWNKVRIMSDVESAILDDLALSPARGNLDDALNFSRSLNEKFSGDIMSTIMRHAKTGGSMAPELTLEGLGSGPKGAVQIRKILAASPQSKSNIEEVLKMDIVASKAIKDGRIDLNKAKQYMAHNEEIMDMFPVLKENMEEAIALEEKAKWVSKTVQQRGKSASRSISARLAEAKPGTVINTIMKSKYPEKEMKRQLRRLNDTGREGVKNDIIDMLISKSKTSDVGADGLHMLSGKKALGFWNENKGVLKQAFSAQEQKRVDRIIQTLRLGDNQTDLPLHTASEALKPRRTALAYVVEVAAARLGSAAGSGTSGASLKTASQGANTARRIMGNIDIGTAKKILKDAIHDRELFLALSEDMTTLAPDAKAMSVIKSWMLAHAVESAEPIYDE